ncbi:MAG: alpha/beta hydrolase [Desulfobacteraceae bacterium]|nr:alpha/beta hydrolase [Desulfobacteraceae bacterium]
MPYTKAGDIQLYYEEHGKGEPLVLIAGAGMDSRGWGAQTEAFAQKFRVIVFDHRGSGRSEAPKQPYSIDMLTHDTANLLKAMGVESAHILGLSMGGMIAQQLAIEHPQVVKRLILAASTAHGRSINAYFAGVVKRWERERTRVDQRIKEMLPLQFTPGFLRNKATVGMLTFLIKNDRYPQAVDALSRQVDAALAFDCRDRLAQITAPTLILAAREDINAPVALSEELQRLIPKARLAVIDGAHGFNLENPRLFNREVLQFLEAR